LIRNFRRLRRHSASTVLNQKLFITYALQDQAKHDPLQAGAGMWTYSLSMADFSQRLCRRPI